MAHAVLEGQAAGGRLAVLQSVRWNRACIDRSDSGTMSQSGSIWDNRDNSMYVLVPDKVQEHTSRKEKTRRARILLAL